MEKAIDTRSKFQAIIFPVLDVLLNGGNLAIHIYISWYLTSGDYGILNAYFSLLFVLMIFGMPFKHILQKLSHKQNFSKNTKTNFIVKMNQMNQRGHYRYNEYHVYYHKPNDAVVKGSATSVSNDVKHIHYPSEGELLQRILAGTEEILEA